MNEKPDSGSASDPRVLLLTMPWAEPAAPSLALGTLKAILARDGIAADVHSLHLTLIREIGLKFYQQICSLGDGTFRGEIFFSPYYFDRDFEDFAHNVIRPHYEKMLPDIKEVVETNSSDTAEDFIARCEDLVIHGIGKYLKTCAEEIDWSKYDIVGFSLMFDQTLAALCMARWVKENFPEKTVIFGGPNCDGEMGLEMLRSFQHIDVVAVGEADHTIVPLVRSIREGKPLEEVQGIGFRRNGTVVQTKAPELIRDLDALPMPAYDDYFEQRKTIHEELTTFIFFESSRGCWWGQKSLCTFCGLNANGLQFRRKSAERVVDEILTLEKRYGISMLVATDNILDMSYFDYVLPELKKVNEQRELEKRFTLFYETKSNIRKDQMILMLEAGIRKTQPGIESFSDGILKKMRKGATGIQQMQFVKWATELGMAVAYGMLYANPNDDPEDYREMEKQVDFLDHLSPPEYLTPIALDRFSPYWMEAAEHGISNIRPSSHYKSLFPDDRIDLMRLVYRYEFDHSDRSNQELREVTNSCIERFRKWQKNYRPNTLVYDEYEGDVFIRDRRDGKANLARLKGLQAQIFLFCDQNKTLPMITKRFPELSEAMIEQFLDKLMAMKWIYKDQRGRYLSMPIRRALKFSTEVVAPPQEELLAKAS